jgi:hypothetical protein
MTPTEVRDKVLHYAASQIGYSESESPCTNSNKYAPMVGHANCNPWCASFINACFKQAGCWELLPSHSAYTPTSFQGFVDEGQTVDHTRPELWLPGDVLYYEFPGMGRISHIGINEKYLGNDQVQDIEGNTNAAGSRTGGSVLRKARNTSMVKGVGRPDWARAAQITIPTQKSTEDQEMYIAYAPKRTLIIVGFGPLGFKPLDSNAEAKAWNEAGVPTKALSAAEYDLIMGTIKR